MKFDLPKDQSSIIKVVGVGGGGSNAVNHMYNQGITGVDFIICNTDAQALELSPIVNKIQLGTTLTEGLGAGANPEVGKNAAIEDIESLKKILETNTKMVFVTAGMGGGTGTGAAPVIAEAARELGILTVGIVSVPFSFEGRKRKQQADAGLEELRKHVDTLLIINNDKLREMHGNLKMSEAFSKADNILTVAAKGIAEIITVAGYINVDFEDVRTVMSDGGTAIMGSATAEGENRAIKAVSEALSSPLLNDNDIQGANYILLNITSGDEEITMDEIDEITDYIQNEAGYTAELIWGNGTDESLGEKVSVTVIATGFGSKEVDSFQLGAEPKKVVRSLDDDVPTSITQTVSDEVVEEKVEDTIEEPFLKTEETTESAESQVSFEFNVSNEPKSWGPANEVQEEKEEPKEIIRYNLEDDFEDDGNEPTNDTELNIELKNETEEVEEVSHVEAVIEEETQVAETDMSFEALDPSPKSFEGEAKDEVSTEEETEEKDEPVYTNRIPDEDQLKKSQERIMKIKALGMKMKTPSGINDLEKEPAYKRRNINLDSVPHSSENTMSRFSLSDDDEGSPKLNDNNSFLHDNVD